MTEPGEALPSAAALRAYMTATGWTAGPPGAVGAIWAKGNRSISVPHEDDSFLIRTAVHRVAAAEGRTPGDVARGIIAVYGAPGPPETAREATLSVAASQDSPAAPENAGALPGQVSEESVDLALAAVARYWKEAHAILQAYPSRDLARAMLEAAAPLIRADERERIAQMADRNQAVCTGDEGTSCYFSALIRGGAG